MHHIHSYLCSYFTPLDHSLKPMTLGAAIMIICTDKVTSLQQPFHILRFSPVCSATSMYLHLSPNCEDHTKMMNISVDTTNINAINLTLDIPEFTFSITDILEHHYV